MFYKLKANILFNKFLKRSSIEGAYALKGVSDSWYDTIVTVHNSLAKIKELPSERVEITSGDGLKLKGIYYPLEGSDKTVIFVHGYKSHAERESAFPGLFYRSLGYNVLVYYGRAHGISEGKYITFGAKEVEDLILWTNLVNKKHPSGSILIHGFSMGGQIALLTCDKQVKNLSAIVSDAPCVCTAGVIQEACQNAFKKDYKKVSECAMAIFSKKFGVDSHQLNGKLTVANSKCPIFFTAGSTELLQEELEDLSSICPTYSKVVILEGCEHGNGMYKQTQVYQGELKEFLKNC